ncbi:SLATT domain-containing protein [Azospirillum formosense]|uniref:SLATT domain-containing protein n=1 Tax=Azospirillum formosense TaxID=861533 RepID=A0ABX2KQG2_9PROT|nr:SLATT domain-containing protein [Azospirillum formosense]MBY3755755.1 SLATT domain-containing protein [Azospirillum formosense]NUB18370.1 SLATT domain-containing protein [Azospirillum formosense]
MSAVRDRIWITSKTRMISERRYLSYDLAAHIMINTVSVVLLLTSIYPDEIGAVVPGLSKINVASSLLLFAATLIIYGFKFGERAARHRECYLKLQRLIEDDMPASEMASKYSAALECYPNHADRDYFDLVFERHFKMRDAIKCPGSNDRITPGYWVILSYIMRRVSFFSLCYLIPFGVVAASLYALVV